MALQADTLRDLKLDSDRQIQVGATGDWELTEGLETVEQSVGIHASEAVRPLIGEQIDGQTLEDVQNVVERTLSRDPQIEDVKRVNVTEINLADQRITVKVFTGLDNTFDLDIDV
jgi:hypothetical protein